MSEPQAMVRIGAGDLFILRVAAQGFVLDHPDSPNVPSIRAAIESAVEALRRTRTGNIQCGPAHTDGTH